MDFEEYDFADVGDLLMDVSMIPVLPELPIQEPYFGVTDSQSNAVEEKDHNYTQQNFMNDRIRSPTPGAFGPGENDVELTPLQSPTFADPVTTKSLYDLRNYMKEGNLPKDYQPDIYELSREFVIHDNPGYDDTIIMVINPNDVLEWIAIRDMSDAYKEMFEELRCNICQYFPRNPKQCTNCLKTFCGSCLDKIIDLKFSCNEGQSTPVDGVQVKTMHEKMDLDFFKRNEFDSRLQMKCEFNCNSIDGTSRTWPYMLGDYHNLQCEFRKCMKCGLYIKKSEDQVVDLNTRKSKHSTLFKCLLDSQRLLIYIGAFELLNRHVRKEMNPSESQETIDNYSSTLSWEIKFIEAESERIRLSQKNLKLEEEIKILKANSNTTITSQPSPKQINSLALNVEGNPLGDFVGLYTNQDEGCLKMLRSSNTQQTFRFIRDKAREIYGEGQYDIIDIKAHIRSDEEEIRKLDTGVVINVVQKGLFEPNNIYRVAFTHIFKDTTGVLQTPTPKKKPRNRYKNRNKNRVQSN